MQAAQARTRNAEITPRSWTCETPPPIERRTVSRSEVLVSGDVLRSRGQFPPWRVPGCSQGDPSWPWKTHPGMSAVPPVLSRGPYEMYPTFSSVIVAISALEGSRCGVAHILLCSPGALYQEGQESPLRPFPPRETPRGVCVRLATTGIAIRAFVAPRWELSTFHR